MKQLQLFCLKSCLFVVSAVLLSYICNIDTLKAYLPCFGGGEVYRAILKSKKKVSFRKLLIGDSTAGQFFDNRNEDEDYYSLACNQAVSICGQFFLLDNFLKAGNRPEEVYMLFTPESFNDNVNQTITYHYFLKPFYREEYKPQMTGNVINQVRQIPFHEFSQLPFIISPAWAPDYVSDRRTDTFLSPVSIDYLTKIDSLRSEYDFKLYLVPAFISESRRERISNYKTDGIKDSEIARSLTTYLENAEYLPDNCFKDDIHLQNPDDYKDMMLKEMDKIKAMTDDRQRLSK